VTLRPFVFALLFATAAEAGPRDFAFTWDARTLEPGKAQPFFELTPRTGRRVYYSRFDSNGGAIIGVAKGLETYLELDTYFDFTGQPPVITGSGAVTNIWRYSLLDPKDPLGILFQARISADTTAVVLGARAVVSYRPQSLRLTFNAAIDRTLFFEEHKDAVKTRTEEALALGYALKNTLTPALEFSAQQSMTDYTFGGSAFFVGGSLTCERKWGWFSLGMMIQAAAIKPEADVGDGEKLELRDHERFLFRFGIGVNAL
jgi:hypothetical protein